MAKKLLFELVSPERLILSQEVDYVSLPGSEGYITVMGDHMPVISSVGPGIVTVKSDQEEHRFVVFGGFVDITPRHCSLLADSAIPLEELNIADIRERIEQVKAALEAATTDEVRNKLEDFFHQLTTVQGVVTQA